MITLDIILLIGILFGIGVYLIIQGSWIPLLFGNILLSNAVNIFILAMSGDPHGKHVPLVQDETLVMVDPLPQALILTAIVISFGLTAYLIVYLYHLLSGNPPADFAPMYAEEKEEEIEPWG